MNSQEYLTKANKLHFEGKFEEAIEYYNLSINIEPTVEAYSFLAWAYSQLGRNEEAIDKLNKAIALDENFGPAYNDIGTNLYNLGRNSEAITYFQTAITKMNSENQYIPYFNMGQVFEKESKLFEALGCYSMSIKLKPDYELAKTAAFRIHTFLN